MTRYRPLFRVAQLPVFQNRMFHSREDAINCAKGDMELVQDLESGMILNKAFEPALMRYDPDYQNEQGWSDVFQRHLDDVSGLIVKHFRGGSLIEVGCGKGGFLEQLQSLGFGIIGCDPTYEGSNPAVIKELFTPRIGREADGIVLRHVLEHIKDPVAFLMEIRDTNGGRGTIYIEVPCFDWICEHRAWFDIFYEHVNYFRLSDFQRMFGVVHEARRTFNGQYLSVVADLSTIRSPVRGENDEVSFPANFTAAVERYAARLRNGSEGKRTHAAIWGGASKGVIFSLYMQRAGALVETVIDINPAKQGKYLPASGLKVQSPEHGLRALPAGSDLLVMNGNYLGEIRTLTHNRFNYLLVENENV
jgi:Methyltransferase domain/C-methyltransferase C-terminal domain